jgi:hypothetical protein
MLYHISTKPLTGEELNFIPRIPPKENRMTYEDTTTPRICVSTVIEGALQGACSHIADKLLIEAKTGESQPIYVYIPEEDIEVKYIVSNEELISRGLVPDADNTGEIWITKPVKMKLHKVIELFGMSETWVVESECCCDEDEDDRFYVVDDFFENASEGKWHYWDVTGQCFKKEIAG